MQDPPPSHVEVNIQPFKLCRRPDQVEPVGSIAAHDDAVVPTEQCGGRSLHDSGHHRSAHRVQTRLAGPRKTS